MLRQLLRLAVAVCVFPFALNIAVAQTTSLPLNTGWTVRMSPTDPLRSAHPKAAAWLRATVPGVVQTDLMAAGLLANPYASNNEALAQWVGLADWQYRKTFTLDAALLAKAHLDLVFEGLDTLAVVRVNGVQVLKADNMYRSWRVPAKGVLRAGDNLVEIDISSPIKALQPMVMALPHSLPGSYDSPFGDEPVGRQTAGYLRKAGYQYGWDWAPRLVALGVWKPVRLEAYDSLRLQDFHVAQLQLNDDLAVLNAQVEVQSDIAQTVNVQVEITDPMGHVSTVTRDAAVTAGVNRIALPVQIAQPHRWWPVGYGKPEMYGMRATVRHDGREIGTSQRHIGLRTVEVRSEPDRWGRSFALVVNGVPIFAKGANLVPFDSFPSRVTRALMEHVLQSAVQANMNIVRVWGGGTYLDEDFYEMTDALGLMVWQDFMFGGALPPPDAGFQENTRLEAVEQVRRLRNHPSVVLWCGNNEVQVSWEKWADRQVFKAAITPQEREKIAVGMVVLFGQVLRTVVAENDPGTPYVAGSPSTDYRGPADQMNDGDVHFWDVWSKLPLDDYLTTTPRYISEFGLQSMPSLATIEAFVAPRSIDTLPVQVTDSKYDSGAGNSRLLGYIRDNYGEPASFPDYVYLSQVLQAEGMEMAVMNMRASRPRGMGTMYWTLNDSWPGQINALWAGPAWGSVDYDGRWKAAQYRARRFYAPVAVSALRRSEVTGITLISDRRAAFKASWRVRVMDFDGRTLSERAGSATAAPLAATPLLTLTDAQLLGAADPHRTVALVDLMEDGQTVSHASIYFVHARDLALSAPGLEARLASTSAGHYALTLSAKTFARAVWIDFGKIDAALSDNAFDLPPGQTVTIDVTSAAAVDDLRKTMTVRSLYGTTGRKAR